MDQFTLKELNELIKATLDTHLEPSYWVVAEIGELRVNQRGHCYMDLVQKENEELVARIRANIWAYTYRNLRGWFEATTGQPLKPGLKILANVMVQFHEIYGISLIVRDIDANFTLGERAKKRQEIIDRLMVEGLLEKNKALQLPVVPQRIAVISSPTAAGFGDFQNQLVHNPYNFKFSIKLFKSIMQGEEAAEGILQALDRINESYQNFDVVAIIRGGGSQVDLDCFDDYHVCKQIAQMPLPVISGIGHERDQTITDLVSHTSLKTPTAVSELLLNGILQFDAKMNVYAEQLFRITGQTISQEQMRLNGYYQQLRQTAHLSLQNKVHKLHTTKERLQAAVKLNMINSEKHIEKLETTLSLLDPDEVLRRGYTLSTVNNKRITRDLKIKKGDKLKTYSKHLIIDSTVDKSKPNH